MKVVVKNESGSKDGSGNLWDESGPPHFPKYIYLPPSTFPSFTDATLTGAARAFADSSFAGTYVPVSFLKA